MFDRSKVAVSRGYHGGKPRGKPRGKPDGFARNGSYSLLAWLVLFVGFNPAVQADDAADFFHQRVVPILQQHCFSCHSHAAQKMEGDLALDWRSGWSTGGVRGPAIVPGKPEESLLVRAIRHVDDDLKMPEKKIDAAAIETIVQWIGQGAFDDRVIVPQGKADEVWWSLKPLPKYSELDRKATDAGAASVYNNPIDEFIGSRLAAEGLTASAAAAPRELMRRLFFDLVGLPPSPESVASFEAEPSDANYARIVDQLLESPRYGERWARHWFDTIHFADSHGYEHDVGRDHAWPYRDYVINALNADLDWSSFIRQQLAVDYFQPEASHLTPALGFLGAGTFDYSTYQTGPVTFDYLDRDDLLTQTMAAFVSTTANCARCHAHKFDPVQQEDYYALQAVFSGIVKGDIHYDADPGVAAQRRQWTAMLDAAERGDAKVLLSQGVSELVEEWERGRSHPVQWQSIKATTFVSTHGSTLTQDANNTIVASGPAPEIDTYVVTATAPLPRITAVRLDVLSDDALPMKGPGRCQNGNLHLSDFEMKVFVPGEPTARTIALVRATADFNQEGWGVQRAIDKDLKTAWGIYPAVGQSHYAVFELAEPLEMSAATWTLALKQLHGGSHLIGSFRISVTDAPAEQTQAMPADVATALETVSAKRSVEQKVSIARYVARLEAQQQLRLLPPQATVYAAGARVDIPLGSGKSQAVNLLAPKKVHLLKRGDINQPQKEVLAGALSMLGHLPSRFTEAAQQSEPARRAALANWIAHPDNVLTWRSIVNRVWHFHFGRGLCDTPSDLGRMGGVPSHPELLDWLAIWFRDEAAGSLKKLHRLIVTSQTYRQSSTMRPDAHAIDSSNRFLWRQNRLRLDADAYRDYVLAVSGSLDARMGGPAIQHFHQSPGAQLTPKLDYAAYDWSSPGANRRSIYRYVWRGIPDPLMSALDFPDLGLLTPARSQSISPLQSLALLNNNFVLFYSEKMAEQLMAQASHSDAQIELAVQRCYQRSVTNDERMLYQTYVQRHSLAALCRLLLNSSEFLLVP